MAGETSSSMPPSKSHRLAPLTRRTRSAHGRGKLAGLSDLEFDGDTVPDADGEPSLGSLMDGDQIGWARGADRDCEDENDGREDDELEDDPAEGGIGDTDGMLEQFPNSRGSYGERVEQ
jgi:hypothetical protein